MADQIAAAFALSAFAVAIASGLASSVDPGRVLVRSLVVLVCAGAMGRVLGWVASVALNEHLTRTTVGSPIPEPIRVSPSADVDLIEGVDSP
ncbi:MAG: hypothetical protein K8E66_01610 [Phycisphaerales bacterium]|nr:hypothetical protein [Phycisphaerales bacterium]